MPSSPPATRSHQRALRERRPLRPEGEPRSVLDLLDITSSHDREHLAQIEEFLAASVERSEEWAAGFDAGLRYALGELEMIAADGGAGTSGGAALGRAYVQVRWIQHEPGPIPDVPS